jgi:hypothetical protein
MLMRHFGYGVGHMQLERQHEELDDGVEDATGHEGDAEVGEDDVDDIEGAEGDLTDDSGSDGSRGTDSDTGDSSDGDIGGYASF